MQVVTGAFDAADDWIVEQVAPADVVVTADIPLASRCLKSGARVLGPAGKPFTADNIGNALATRELMSDLRAYGVGGGPPPFGPRDRSRFLEALELDVREAKRQRAGRMPASVPPPPMAPLMLSTTNLSIQFEAKPLFEHVSVKFGDGNRYGLIGANGCGKSTLMKILGGELEQSSGDVVLQAGMRMGKLNQNQFAYEDERVLDVVMQGHAEMWKAMRERDAIYANAEATDDDYMRAAELEGKVAEYDGYTAEARAGAILIDAGIDEDKHNLPMREIPPGPEAARAAGAGAVLAPGRAAARRADQQPRHPFDRLARAHAQRVRRDHDHHQPRPALPEPGVHAHRRPRLPAAQDLPGQLRRLHARLGAGARSASRRRTPRPRRRSRDLQEFVRRFSANASKARQATSRKRQLEKIKIEEIRPSSRQNPYIRFEQAKKLYRSAVTVDGLTFRYPGADKDIFTNLKFTIEAEQRVAIIGPNGIGKTTLMRCLAGDLRRPPGAITWVENAQLGYMPQDPQRGVRAEGRPADLDVAPGPARPTTSRSRAPRSGACCSRATRPRSRSRCCRAARRAA